MTIVNFLQDIHFASFYWVLLLPSAMIAIDVITGLIGAWVHNNFESSIMRAGLGKKAGELMIILIGVIFTAGMELPDYMLSGLAVYIILMELMSVMENLDNLGAPVPSFIKKTINNVGNSIQNDDLPDLQKKIEELENMIKLLQDEDDRK